MQQEDNIYVIKQLNKTILFSLSYNPTEDRVATVDS